MNKYELNKALKEYSMIVKTMRKEYNKNELTNEIIRLEHSELNFMDDEEIQELINNVNNSRK
jgi:hypothetical protein